MIYQSKSTMRMKVNAGPLCQWHWLLCRR